MNEYYSCIVHTSRICLYMFIMVCAYVRACVNLYRALKGEKKNISCPTSPPDHDNLSLASEEENLLTVARDLGRCGESSLERGARELEKGVIKMQGNPPFLPSNAKNKWSGGTALPCWQCTRQPTTAAAWHPLFSLVAPCMHDQHLRPRNIIIWLSRSHPFDERPMHMHGYITVHTNDAPLSSSLSLALLNFFMVPSLLVLVTFSQLSTRMHMLHPSLYIHTFCRCVDFNLNHLGTITLPHDVHICTCSGSCWKRTSPTHIEQSIQFSLCGGEHEGEDPPRFHRGLVLLFPIRPTGQLPSLQVATYTVSLISYACPLATETDKLISYS